MQQFLVRSAPLIFVVLWSTGFIGAKYGLPYSEPFTFLAIRVLIVAAIFLVVVAFWFKRDLKQYILFHSMVVGCLVHGLYLGGVFYAIDNGMDAGVSSLAVAIQPLLTVFIASLLLGETTNRREMAGFMIALMGVLLVLLPNLVGGQEISGVTFSNLIAIGFSVFGISLGTVYQKRFLPKSNLIVSTFGQYLGAILCFGLASFLFEDQQVNWTGDFIFALSWLVLVLSIGAVGLLMFLIEKNSAISVANLFYLVPVSTAIIAYFIFGETLQLIQLFGGFLVVVSVAYGMKKRRP